MQKSTIDQSIRDSKENKNWIRITKPQKLTIEDEHKIDSLKCLKIVNDSL